MAITVYTTNIQPSSLGHRKFAIDKPLSLGVYQWQTSSDLGYLLCTPNSRGLYYKYVYYICYFAN